ncbi:amidohydrolase family protein [Roseisolibacter sp. H3M3-2]|uniref:amidohydrolase family protein n=1 Tax=Roseisolibacter sp. H3M3-2 TaxID=3031323 RepID=UPI0023DAB386|nr:amidohydrolase family protein [Roseisolibacter sp. H3M3-2]MDF1502805.1 amidohydrolase family protein [Roseisolibacter sp. H3M3-2]
MRLIAARWVVPVSAPPIADGAVAVDGGGRIAWVGPRADAPAGDVEELGDAILLPGLVNAHTHLELTTMRGLLEDADFFAWIRTLTRARAEVLTDDDLRDAARLGVLEGLAAGVTTYADTSASGAPLDALLECGARGIVYQEVFGPDAAQRDDAMRGLRERVAALRARATPLVRVGVSPHAVYSVHEELLLDACAFALGAGLPVAMHVSESAAEIAFLREGTGPFADFLRGRGIAVGRRAHSPVHLLAELGIAATARPLLIHGVRFDDSDVQLAAHYDCPVAHCPASNAKLGHGVAPLRALLDAGVRVGLGTDSVASNNRLDLLDEARTAVLQQRGALARADALSAAEAVALATIGGARALGLDAEVGTLEVGKAADLAAWRLDGPRGVGADDPAAALAFALAGRPAAHVEVAGRVLVRDGGPPHPDAAAILARGDAAARGVSDWRRAAGGGR